MSVTIKDIARLANVSHTTVSRALNESPLINRETKEKIQEIAKRLHYTPNYSAKSLVLDRSYNLGLFFSTLNEGTSAGFFFESVRGVNNVVKGSYNLVVRGIDDYKDYNGITRKSFDGVLVMSQSARDDEFIRHLHESGIPFVVLNRHVEGYGSVNILSDDRQGAFQIVQFLIHQGHRRIAIIEGKAGFKSTQERKKGYLEAMAEHDLQIREEYQVQGSYDLESGYIRMKDLLKLPELPTAIFCSNDDMAVGAMKAALEYGLKIPDDLSLAGFDDNLFSGYLSPALTTIKRPVEQMSRKGAAVLVDLIESKDLGKQDTVYLPTELMIRDSVSRR
ncbi:LacI family DNA-binding transcriptional regulator [Paenibacillus sp. J2TS4]|uniref:LacI family DNA-binding transcriptional regulator n=1 Tax=Paenibacillus sp. J2TS4 TaxID=2807194 RepID=UPI001B10FB29|nr:LacI family DNA-binding transcriptional regulator [Paenibacillus sp. J2TS4]GIP32876.1 LacI family transcriptional regulator [Paenibacillus sp. J2TS4]